MTTAGVAPRGGDLVSQILAYLAEQPRFFYDIVRHFQHVEYRDLLVAWGQIRSQVTFERDTDGRYILAGSADTRVQGGTAA